jgi:ATP sulfurylase
LGVLKAVSGNDDVKVAIVNNNGAPLIITATSKHIQQASVVETSCSAVASIVLRNPAHCKVFMEAEVADVIVKGMQIHADKMGVQVIMQYPFLL